MSRETRETEIDRLCDEARCTEKIRKIHFDQFVHRNWHPHPPADFMEWWSTQPDHTINGIDAKRAYNCACYYQQFLELKELGVA